MTTTRKNFALAAAAFWIAAGATSASAKAFDTVRLFGVLPGQSGGKLALAVIAGHEYQGADERRTLLFPGLDYEWANGWSAGTSNGIGHNFAF